MIHTLIAILNFLNSVISPKRGNIERERMLWRGGEVRRESSLKLDRVINQFDFFYCT